MTDTSLNTLPDDRTDKSLTDKARDAASSAGEKVSAAATSASEKVTSAASTASEKISSAASTTVEAAKDHPYAAAGIAAGVVAAVGGAAYAATKLMADDKPAKRAPAKKPTKK